ncbi:MAG: DUF327 family protein [Spirochaetaceae bacterium]|jgi:uncharacterized protein YaaR (DUF327 family)|nr:DUF327 family protein [Spirochaetaceae bacterium]
MPLVNWNPFTIPNPLLNENLKHNAGKTSEKEKTKRAPAFSRLLKKGLTGTKERIAISAADAALSQEKIVETLLDDVFSAGDDLKNRPFPNEIKKYRDCIKKFIGYVVENNYTIEKNKGVPNGQKPKYNRPGLKVDPEKRSERMQFSAIKIIDQKLDKLAAEILMVQNVNIKLLADIEEINGLLIDMLQ